ncbi:relaxase/mobilization nuclease domain-containing protein [Nonlabens agnitus]|uniref:MobA/VirD2-like nuclease domain-containing protein n=1 Tax=Nonlabens agnitus TaxID=870484 RepID=A0A2S9WS05_9FLAO|nr:relaxase/mobilization nuclease domain-containing protein [Nonlabens agnitus]PRP66277.1 hypothetical protein BST86_03805 [Nonlabens agnitus]
MMVLAQSISHTSESMEYGWNEKEKKATVISQKYMIADNPKEATEMFKVVQASNSTCPKNTISIVLSRSATAEKKFTNKNWQQYIDDLLEGLRLENHQHIAFRHFDKNHDHVHLYINRINFQGKAFNDSFIGSKAGDIADQLNIKYGIERPKQIKKDNEEKLRNEYKHDRKSIHSHNMYVIEHVKPKSFSHYVSAFAKADINVVAITSKNGNLNGFRYEKGGLSLKASLVHRSMSLTNLIKSLFPEIKLSELRKLNLKTDGGKYGSQANQKQILDQLDDYVKGHAKGSAESIQYESKVNEEESRHAIYLQNLHIRNLSAVISEEEYIKAFDKVNIKVTKELSTDGSANEYRFERSGFSFKGSSIHSSMSSTNIIKYLSLKESVNNNRVLKTPKANFPSHELFSDDMADNRKDVTPILRTSSRDMSIEKGVDADYSEGRIPTRTEVNHNRQDERFVECSKVIYIEHQHITNQLRVNCEHEYVSAFAKANVKVTRVQNSDGSFKGFQFERSGFSFNGSDIHSSMSLTNIEKSFSINELAGNTATTKISQINQSDQKVDNGKTVSLKKNISNPIVPSSDNSLNEKRTTDNGYVSETTSGREALSQKGRNKNSEECLQTIYQQYLILVENLEVSNEDDYINAFAKANIKVTRASNHNGSIDEFRYELAGHCFEGGEVHRSMTYEKIKSNFFIPKVAINKAPIDGLSYKNSSQQSSSDESVPQKRKPVSPFSSNYKSTSNERRATYEDNENEKTSGKSETDQQPQQKNVEEYRQAIYLQHLFIINNIQVKNEEEYINAFAKVNIKVTKLMNPQGIVDEFSFELAGHSFKGRSVNKSMSLKNIRNNLNADVRNSPVVTNSNKLTTTQESMPDVRTMDVIESITSQFIPSSPIMHDESEGGIDETLGHKKKRKRGLKR